MKTAPIGNKQEFDTEKTGPNMQSHSFTIVGIRSPQMQNSTVTYYYGHTWVSSSAGDGIDEKQLAPSQGLSLSTGCFWWWASWWRHNGNESIRRPLYVLKAACFGRELVQRNSAHLLHWCTSLPKLLQLQLVPLHVYLSLSRSLSLLLLRSFERLHDLE